MRASAPLGTPAKPLLEFLFWGDATPAPTLLDNTVGAVQEALGRGGDQGRCVVVGPPMDLPVGVERVREEPVHSGPASAIAAGVEVVAGSGAADSDVVFVLAADEADPAAAITALRAAARRELDREGWIISRGGHIEPLLCLVKVGAARRAFGGVRGGSVRMVLAGLDLAEVPLAGQTDVDTWAEAQAAGIGVAEGPATWRGARARVASLAEEMWHQRVEKAVVATPAVGQVLVSPALAPMDVPHYTSSAMDGYAVSGPGPWTLLEDHAEGVQGRNIHRAGGTLQPGEALPVLTGSLLPEGADAVVRSEHTHLPVGSGELHLSEGMSVSTGADIRHAGEELRRGEELLPAGTVLSARHLALLGACAVDEVRVAPPLTVDFAFTGNEVVTDGLPGPGEVRDAFSSSFPALVEHLGAEVRSVSRLKDDPAEVQDWLQQARADIVVITGGSGHSGQDFARTFITEQADVVLAESVRCAPGHPTLLAARQLQDEAFHNEDRTQFIMGAPGNPLAAHVALHSFLAPALAVASGLDFPATKACIAGEDLPTIRKPRTRLIPARLDSLSNRATPMTRTNSHMLSGYAKAQVLLVVPPEGVTSGEAVAYLPLPQ